MLHLLVHYQRHRLVRKVAPWLAAEQLNLPRASDQCTPLHLAVWKKNTKIITTLVALGADRTLLNSYGEDGYGNTTPAAETAVAEEEVQGISDQGRDARR